MSTKTSWNSGSNLATGTDAGLDQPLNQGQKAQEHVAEQSDQNAFPSADDEDATKPVTADTAD